MVQSGTDPTLSDSTLQHPSSFLVASTTTTTLLTDDFNYSVDHASKEEMITHPSEDPSAPTTNPNPPSIPVPITWPKPIDEFHMPPTSRMVNGIGFTGWLFVKKYCTDPRIVGFRRRTTLSAALVVSQGLGFVLGPLVGGQLAKVGGTNGEGRSVKERLFNGESLPGWLMAGLWVVFWVAMVGLFVEAPVPSSEVKVLLEERAKEKKRNWKKRSGRGTNQDVTTDTISRSGERGGEEQERDASSLVIEDVKPIESTFLDETPLSVMQICVSMLLCLAAYTTFFELGAWESMIPLFGNDRFGWTIIDAGNFIGFVGIAALPFLLLLVFTARHLQDRHILTFGLGIATIGNLIQLILMKSTNVIDNRNDIGYRGDGISISVVSYSATWFLVCVGTNLATSITLSLNSKVLPDRVNDRANVAIQMSNYMGRFTGAVWGTSAYNVGGYFNVTLLEFLLPVLVLVVSGMLRSHLRAKTG
ncbi:hypothetical protein HDU76_013339 [Blyttiomyces sp. JEL0837]|nr:hypothetical protein HDU76_013339 [Blyttiomyces sp. JEL0837]